MVGFSSHHVEALPFIRDQMEKHQVIVLEEPPSSDLLDMLHGNITVDDYIMAIDSGFPEFDRQMCSLLQELHHEGGRIIQVEPYLERLLQIHELFAAGVDVKDVVKEVDLREVYQAERRATGSLISYYSVSMNGPFAAVVEAVMVFAREDANRLTLIERLRA